MEKVKEYFKNLFGDQKKFIKKYCITFILIAGITLLMIIEGFEPEHIEEFYTVMALTNILVFVVESLFEFRWYRIPMYIISFGLSILAKEFMFSSNFTLNQGLLIAGLYISVFIIAIYKIIKDSEVTFSQYISRVFQNGIIFGIAFSVIQIGTMFIVFVATELLLGNINFDLYTKVEILILGFFVIPGMILSLLNVKKEIIKPIQILIYYIILPIVNTSELIIYIYLLKILITREIPSNMIFAIIAGLFVFACPTWIMIQDVKDKNKYIKLNAKIIPYSFIPLICMQLYSVGIRIVNMGVTEQRYFGVILVLFEIATIILTVIRNQKHLAKILLVGITLTLITMSIPKINVIDASIQSQLKRLTSIYKENTNFETLSKEEKEKVISAYRYLEYHVEGSKFIPTYIDEAKLDNAYYGQPLDEINNENTINISEDGEVNIEGFKTLREVRTNEYSYSGKDVLEIADFYDLKVYEDNIKNEEIINSMKKFIIYSVKNEEIQTNVVELNDNTRIWISSMDVTYNKENKKIKSIYINGYILMK